ncbi:hypothetical protein GRX03_02050 [Halovenus sp. WSH3]|uniref:PKD/Chitinase domain-containing protein n=1 Tax=Halovenus carboxidivorans TaxID=2692199 RepID=A0A6B0T582_9EURY|nr:PKD domain-containing protein [Halovenus carboxidivorans]MXR50391.1 hypothetical protein [Halovenus carboxidivorans]
MTRRLAGALLAVVLLTGASGVVASASEPAELLAVGDPGGDTTARPYAEAGLNQTVPVGGVVYLDAYGSRGADGDIVAYEWRIERPDGTTRRPDCATCELTEFRPASAGQYAVTLTVEDEDGRTATDTMYVTAVSQPAPSAAVSGPDELLANETATVTLDATATTGKLSSVEWYVDGVYREGAFLDTTSTTDTITVSPEDGGTHTVTAVVRNDNGTATRARQILTVSETVPFEVTITGGKDSVEPGAYWAPSFEVTNTGFQTDTQEIALRIPTASEPSPIATETITLDPGETRQFDSDYYVSGAVYDTYGPSLIWETSSADVDTHAVTVESESDNASTTVAVQPPPNYEVEIVSTTPRETEYEYEVEITNTGGQDGSQTIYWTSDDLSTEYVATSNLRLAGGESKVISGSATVQAYYLSYLHERFIVKSDDDSDSVPLNESSGAGGGGDSGGDSSGDATWDTLSLSHSANDVKVGEYTQHSVSSVTNVETGKTLSASNFIDQTGYQGFAADMDASSSGGVDYQGDIALPSADAERGTNVLYKGKAAGQATLCIAAWHGTDDDKYIQPVYDSVDNGCTTITVESDDGGGGSDEPG